MSYTKQIIDVRALACADILKYVNRCGSTTVRNLGHNHRVLIHAVGDNLYIGNTLALNADITDVCLIADMLNQMPNEEAGNVHV